MSPVVRALAVAAGFALAGCNGSSAPTPIAPEPVAPSAAPEPVAPLAPPEAQGAKADTFTIDYTPLGFKVAIAVPEGGHLCIILPVSAQDPTACMGLDPGAMVEALPEGPERPFGVAYARMGDWSYIVMLAPLGSGIESHEDIEAFLGGAVKPEPSAPGIVPKLVPPSPKENYEIVPVRGVPVVKFRIDTPVPPDSPQYDISSTLHYAAFGGKTAMVSFITSPKDIEQLMPYADATIQSLVLPPREAPERFGKPADELNKQGWRTALVVLGPIAAIGALLFLWLGRGKKAEDLAPAEKSAPAKKKVAPAKKSAPAKKEDEDEDEGEDDE